MLGETPFTKYQYIFNTCLEPLDITEELIYCSLKYIIRSVQSHWGYIIFLIYQIQ